MTIRQQARKFLEDRGYPMMIYSDHQVVELAELLEQFGQASAREQAQRFGNAGIEFCTCGHLNMEHYGAADWQVNPECDYICELKGCECKNFVREPFSREAGTPK